MSLETDILPSVPEIEGAVAELRGKIRAFANETFGQLPDVPTVQPYLVAWNSFVAEFDAYADGWWANPLHRRNELLAYRKRFNGLQTWFSSLGGAAAASVPQYAEKETEGPTYGIPPWVVPVGLGVLALVVFSQVRGLFPSLGSLLPARANPRRRRRRRR